MIIEYRFEQRKAAAELDKNNWFITYYLLFHLTICSMCWCTHALVHSAGLIGQNSSKHIKDILTEPPTNTANYKQPLLLWTYQGNFFRKNVPDQIDFFSDTEDRSNKMRYFLIDIDKEIVLDVAISDIILRFQTRIIIIIIIIKIC